MLHVLDLHRIITMAPSLITLRGGQLRNLHLLGLRCGLARASPEGFVQSRLLRPQIMKHLYSTRIHTTHLRNPTHRAIIVGASSCSSTGATRSAIVSPSFASQSGNDSIRTSLALVAAATLSLNCAYNDNSEYASNTNGIDEKDSAWRFRSVLCSYKTTSCEAQSSKETQDHDQKISNSIDDEENSGEDPYVNLPEQDEPTSCTICLINRQGPCRPFWRKFEKCMKDNSNSSSDDDENDKDESPSMSARCDKYMLPWITCIQQHRNRYTLISNAFFSEEMIDPVEKAVEDNERVLLDASKDGFDIASIVQVAAEWGQYKNPNGDESGSSKLYQKKEESRNDSAEEVEDVTLVEGVVRINLWQHVKGDADGSVPSTRPIEVAFVRDQDGNLLGYEQFFDFKKSIKGASSDDSNEKEGYAKECSDNGDIETTNDPAQSAAAASRYATIGVCNFHVNPKSTKSIQIFALYRDQIVEETSQDVDKEIVKDASETPNAVADGESSATQKKQTLYYSTMIDMNDVPMQQAVEERTTTRQEKEAS